MIFSGYDRQKRCFSLLIIDKTDFLKELLGLLKYHFATSDTLISQSPENCLFPRYIEARSKNKNDFL